MNILRNKYGKDFQIYCSWRRVRMRFLHIVLLLVHYFVITGCVQTQAYNPSLGHIKTEWEGVHNDDIPRLITDIPYLPPPSLSNVSPDVYSILAKDVPLKELLLGLAQKAEMNLDISNEVDGKVTLNIVNQTLGKIMHRISMQYPMRYKIDNDSIEVRADTPYSKSYRVPYLNVLRKSAANITLSMQLESAQNGESETGLQGENTSDSLIESTSQNQFWNVLEENIQKLLDEESSLIINPEVGLIMVNSTHNQHVVVQKYLREVIQSAQRQVLVEATVVEVNLNRNFSSGVDWERLALEDEWSFSQSVTSSALQAASEQFSLGYKNNRGNFNSTLRLLEQFGDVKVLSSPKIMTLNNQPSLLKVVDNRVYFTLDVVRSGEIVAGVCVQPLASF